MIGEEKALMAYTFYDLGMSLSEVAKHIGYERKKLHYYLVKYGFECRPLIRKKKQKYCNDFYTRNSRGYWRKTKGDRELLHRQVWIDNYGPIPKGYEIHHLDENKDNNNIENLALLNKADHSRLHGFVNNQYTKMNPDNYIYKDNFCLECGELIVKRVPSATARATFCNIKCKGKHFKGKRRGFKVA